MLEETFSWQYSTDRTHIRPLFVWLKMMKQLSSLLLFPFLPSLFLPLDRAGADPVIHMELDFDLEENKFTDWEIGPVFSIGEETEIEFPLGQSDGEWEFTPEVKRNFCTLENCSLDIGIGLEIPLSPSEEDEDPERATVFTNIELELEF